MQAPENCCEDCEPVVVEEEEGVDADGVAAAAVERVVGVSVGCERVTKVIEAEDALDGAVVGGMMGELALELRGVVAGSAADNDDGEGLVAITDAVVGVASPPPDAELPEPAPALAPFATHPVPLTVPLTMADADFGNIMFDPGSG